MDLEAYYDVVRPGGVAVSPDGERVAFVARERDAAEDERHASVFVVPADGSREPHRLTRASDASSPQWSPDGGRLAVLAAREEDVALAVEGDDEDGDEGDGDEGDGDGGGSGGSSGDGPRQQVWVFDVERGGDARQVTDRDRGVSEFDWGPGGERLVVASRDPTGAEEAYLDELEDGGPVEVERLQHKYDGAGYLDEVDTHLFVVDVESRRTVKLEDAYGGGANEPATGLQPAWRPDGDRIAFLSNRTAWPDDTAVMDVYTVRPDGTGLERLTDGDVTATGLSYGPAGDLAFVGGDPENFYVPSDVYVHDGEGYESVSEGVDRGPMGAIQWQDEKRLVVPFGDEGRIRLMRLHREGEPERVLSTQGDLETLGYTFDADGGVAAFTTTEPDRVGDVETVALDALDAEADARRRVTALNEAFEAEHDLPAADWVRFESDGETVEALRYRPRDHEPGTDEPRPLLLYVHGGPMAFDSPGFGFREAYWVSEGYTVLEVNYRGSTSYGTSFCEELRGAWNDQEVADLLAGVDHAVEAGWADPGELYVTGFSQGGVNTAYLVAESDRFRAAAAEHGIYDLRSSFGTDDSQNWLAADYGVPWENLDAYDDASSITDVGAIDTPLLVTAGENDHRCPPGQAEQLYVSVRKQGVDAKLVVYQDTNHAIGDPGDAVHRLETIGEWFDAH